MQMFLCYPNFVEKFLLESFFPFNFWSSDYFRMKKKICSFCWSMAVLDVYLKNIPSQLPFPPWKSNDVPLNSRSFHSFLSSHWLIILKILSFLNSTVAGVWYLHSFIEISKHASTALQLNCMNKADFNINWINQNVRAGVVIQLYMRRASDVCS